ncbi:hypothetical protein [Pseudomonas sp. MWU15-20650]|uniref:hypothetical protein n=1 Tax=Pseudomonas sp. MWU15-20650 TaxID=2933107 RepID=UPI00200F9B1E|nr:hypothetical protein [Pseudomonas sp. MWU15-20650]
MLLDNFDAFKGRWPSRSVTPQSLKKMADRQLTGNPTTDNQIRLARELLRRPGLIQALDRNGHTGAVDGRLTKGDIGSFIFSSNPLKLKDDKEIVQDVLNHFYGLADGFWKRDIKLSRFKELASETLTGNPYTDHLIQLSREIMARPELKGLMDNVFMSQRDGRISRAELMNLLR